MTVGDGPLYIGDYFEITCSIVHGDIPVDITWLFNDELLKRNSGFAVEVRRRSSSLTIESIEASHAGNLTCVASNHAGNTSTVVNLNVKGS